MPQIGLHNMIIYFYTVYRQYIDTGRPFFALSIDMLRHEALVSYVTRSGLRTFVVKIYVRFTKPSQLARNVTS